MMEKDLILKIKIIENISIKKWNIWKCDGIIILNNKKKTSHFQIYRKYIRKLLNRYPNYLRSIEAF